MSLALLRIAIALVALFSSEIEIARDVATRPSALWTAPEGLGTLVRLAPPTVASVDVAIAVLRGSAALTALGIATRASAGVLATSMFYVFGVAQLSGAVMHDMHLVWFAALSALAPSGSALSLDAWARGRPWGPAPEAGNAASVAIAASRLFLGLVYFFPGVHKLATHRGLAWITSDALRDQILFKWFESGGEPPWPRIDHAPALLHVAAAGVVAFELSMPLLVSFARTRAIAFALAVGFHALAGHFMRIPYPALAVCAVVLLPGAALRARVLGARTEEGGAPAPPSRVLLASVATFTIAIVVQGARGQSEAFPFACYPKFDQIPAPYITDLAVDVTPPAGETRTFRLPRARRQDEWALTWRTAGLYGGAPDTASLRAFEARVVPRDVPRVRVTWVRERYDLAPERWGAPPIAREVFFTEVRRRD